MMPFWARKTKVVTRIHPHTGERFTLSPARYADKRSRQECRQGHWHHSGEEAFYCDILKVREICQEIAIYRTQVCFDLRLPDPRTGENVRILSTKVDFVVENLDGTQEIHEYKGIVNERWLIASRLFPLCFPDIRYRVVTFRDFN
jgi:hypothetical protein